MKYVAIGFVAGMATQLLLWLLLRRRVQEWRHKRWLRDHRGALPPRDTRSALEQIVKHGAP